MLWGDQSIQRRCMLSLSSSPSRHSESLPSCLERKERGHRGTGAMVARSTPEGRHSNVPQASKGCQFNSGVPQAFLQKLHPGDIFIAWGVDKSKYRPNEPETDPSK
ncbi:hypothetical protein WR25_17429 [Diploscapter pachys]|uniref:Uncharacterized protein n=1 Tax=Diploscapter pachys TaxID=2018661 RepID=A0A2A2JVT6_9BILA|nr:hypothetical protein WR25_17429 [Diploscapter pachys]